jgi:hypothetical protein
MKSVILNLQILEDEEYDDNDQEESVQIKFVEFKKI